MLEFRIKNVSPAALKKGADAPLPDDVTFALQTISRRPLPVIVDSQDRVVSGHMKWKISKQLKLSSIPTLSIVEIRRVANEDCWPFSIEQRRQIYLRANLRPLHQLVAPFEKVHSLESIQRAAHTLDEIGFFLPLVVDNNAWVIECDIYLLAARLLGLTEAPTIRLSQLTPFERERFSEMMAQRLRKISQMN